ncbi:MAG: fasciclin domain-containing protein, partial [Anaerolineae bacterium]|nr:fasciclin domain-containing protein [Anaerolineae bacterium]
MRKTLLPGLLLLGMLMWSLTPAYGQGTSILDIVQGREELSTLAGVLELVDGDIRAQLDGGSPVTLLAPTNVAFANVASALDLPLDDLLQNRDVLIQIVQYHTVPGRISQIALEARVGEVLPTQLVGAFVSIETRDNGTLAFNGVGDVLNADISATNGLVHIIDDVLLNRVITETLANQPAIPAGTETAEPTTESTEATPEPTSEATGEVVTPTEVVVQMVQVRFFHLASDMLAVDVFVNGNLILNDLNYGETSFYVEVTSGPNDLLITATGASPDDALLQQARFPIGTEGPQTIAIIGSLEASSLSFVKLDSAFPGVPQDHVRLLFYNAVVGARAVDVMVDDVRFARLEPYQTTAFELPYDDFDYEIELKPVVGNDVLNGLSINGDDVSPNATYFIGLVGPAEGPQLLFYVLSAADAVAVTDPFLAETDPDLYTLISRSNGLHFFSQVLAAAPFTSRRLHNGGEYTVLAPTDQAFLDLAASTGMSIEDLLQDGPLMADILRYHTLPETVYATDLATYDRQGLPTLYDGYRIGIFVADDDSVLLNGSFSVVNADVPASNGILHTIDAV